MRLKLDDSVNRRTLDQTHMQHNLCHRNKTGIRGSSSLRTIKLTIVFIIISFYAVESDAKRRITPHGMTIEFDSDENSDQIYKQLRIYDLVTSEVLGIPKGQKGNARIVIRVSSDMKEFEIKVIRLKSNSMVLQLPSGHAEWDDAPSFQEKFITYLTAVKCGANSSAAKIPQWVVCALKRTIRRKLHIKSFIHSVPNENLRVLMEQAVYPELSLVLKTGYSNDDGLIYPIYEEASTVLLTALTRNAQQRGMFKKLLKGCFKGEALIEEDIYQVVNNKQANGMQEDELRRLMQKWYQNEIERQTISILYKAPAIISKRIFEEGSTVTFGTGSDTRKCRINELNIHKDQVTAELFTAIQQNLLHKLDEIGHTAQLNIAMVILESADIAKIYDIYELDEFIEHYNKLSSNFHKEFERQAGIDGLLRELERTAVKPSFDAYVLQLLVPLTTQQVKPWGKLEDYLDKVEEDF